MLSFKQERLMENAEIPMTRVFTLLLMVIAILTVILREDALTPVVSALKPQQKCHLVQE